MRDSFVFYRSFAESLEELDDNTRVHCYDAIMKYALDDEEIELEGVEKAIFRLIKPQIDANNKRFENGKRGGAYGRLGGRPTKPQENPKKTPKKPQENPNETPTKPQENPKQTPNDNVNVNVNVNVKEGERNTAPLPQEVFELFNDICKDMQPVKNMTYAREQKIARNGVEGITIDDYREAFTKAQASPFLKGDNSRKWKAGFDWLTDAKNMTKVIEGNYDKKSKGREERDPSKYDDLEDFFAMELQKGAEQ